jgi:hypothetical protein
VAMSHSTPIAPMRTTRASSLALSSTCRPGAEVLTWTGTRRAHDQHDGPTLSACADQSPGHRAEDPGRVHGRKFAPIRGEGLYYISISVVWS